MKFTIPFAPVSAGRPKWNSQGRLSSRAHMPEKYRQFRLVAGDWFEDWLESTNYKLVKYLCRMPDGRKIRQADGSFQPDFYGFQITIILYVETDNPTTRPFPISSHTSDLDNYYKSTTDLIFESDTFKRVAKLNDRLLQSMTTAKVAVKRGEGHIDVDLDFLKV